MSDLVKRLRFGSLTHIGASKMNLEAADRIEQLEAELASGSFYQEKDIDAFQYRIEHLEAQVAAADALAEVAHGFTYEYGHRALKDALTAYRDARK